MLFGTLGSIDATVHRVGVQPGTKPIRQQPYRAGHHSRDMIRDEVNRMLEAKVVRPSTSEWASPVVVVPKKDGSPPGPVISIVFSFGYGMCKSLNSSTSAGHVYLHMYQYEIYLENTSTNQFQN